MQRDDVIKALLELPPESCQIYVHDGGIAACIDKDTPIPKGWKRGMLKWAHEWEPLVRIRKIMN